MTNMKALFTAGLLLAAGAVFAAAPTVDVKGGAAKAGADAVISVTIHPNGTAINSATLVFDVSSADGANVDLSTTAFTAADYPAGWDSPVTNQITTGTGQKRVLYTTATATAMTTDLTFVLRMKQNGTGMKGARLDFVPYDPNTGEGSNVSDADYNTIGLPAASIGITNGASRNLSGTMNNAVSVAPGVIAGVAGQTLWLLDATKDDLAPVTNWATGKGVGSTVSGRPAFGAIDGALAVAVGADNGDLNVFDVTSGNVVGTLAGAAGSLTSIPTAPAIAGNVVFVAGTDAGSVKVLPVTVTGGTAAAGTAVTVAGAASITSSPAVSGGKVIVGTNTTVFYATADNAGVLTPQTLTGVTADDYNTSPVVSGGSAFIGGASGKVYKIDLATGNVTGSSAALPTPLSDPFAQGAKVEIGGGDGKLYTFATGDVATAPTTTDIGGTPLISPVDNGTLVVAATKAGLIKAAGGTVDVGPSLGKAVSLLPGTVPTIVVNKVDGTVYAIPSAG